MLDTGDVHHLELVPTKIHSFAVTKTLSNEERGWLTSKMKKLCSTTQFQTTVREDTPTGRLILGEKKK